MESTISVSCGPGAPVKLMQITSSLHPPPQQPAFVLGEIRPAVAAIRLGGPSGWTGVGETLGPVNPDSTVP